MFDARAEGSPPNRRRGAGEAGSAGVALAARSGAAHAISAAQGSAGVGRRRRGAGRDNRAGGGRPAPPHRVGPGRGGAGRAARSRRAQGAGQPANRWDANDRRGALGGARALRLWLRGEGPLLGALVALDASAAGLSAHGLLLPATGAPALLDGTAPPESACTPAPLLCARAAPGPALRALAPLVLRELIARNLLGGPRDALDGLLQAELSAARGPVLLRVESLEARALGDPAQLLAALPASISSGAAQPDAAPAPGPAPATDSAGATPPAAPGSATVPPGVKSLPSSWTELPAPRRGLLLSPATQLCLQSQADAFWLSSPCAPLPAHFGDAGGARELAATLDTRALARSLASLTALDGFRGSLAAGAFAVKLLWGDPRQLRPGLAASAPLAAGRRAARAAGRCARALLCLASFPGRGREVACRPHA